MTTKFIISEPDRGQRIERAIEIAQQAGYRAPELGISATSDGIEFAPQPSVTQDMREILTAVLGGSVDEAIAKRTENIPELIYMCPICGVQHKDTTYQVPGTGSHACSEDHYKQALDWIRNRPADAGR